VIFDKNGWSATHQRRARQYRHRDYSSVRGGSANNASGGWLHTICASGTYNWGGGSFFVGPIALLAKNRHYTSDRLTVPLLGIVSAIA